MRWYQKMLGGAVSGAVLGFIYFLLRHEQPLAVRAGVGAALVPLAAVGSLLVTPEKKR